MLPSFTATAAATLRARAALDRHRRADDVPPDRRRARARLVGGDRRDAGAGRRARRVRRRLGCSWRSPRCWPGSPCCRWLVGGSSIDWPCDLRRDPRAVPELLRGARPPAQPSASLIPAQHDPSTLLISAGMHPLKPYFLGREPPPHHRLTTCQKCFRTPDIDERRLTKRHLHFFEMLGNFSFGDYFKQGAVEIRAGALARAASASTTTASGSPSSRATRSSASAPTRRRSRRGCRSASRASGSCLLPRSENFWQAGPTGPCGPCSELYYDRGLEFGKPRTTSRASDNERFLEYWNLVFMQYDQEPEGVLTPLPAQNIDTGLGLERHGRCSSRARLGLRDRQLPAADRARRRSSAAARYGQDADTDRALRILADHSRGMSFLIADGVVPSNEDRGYVLRRIMRRAILQGRRIGIEPGFLPRFAAVVRELMGAAYPELDRAGGHDRHVARARGGGVRPDARAGHAHPRRAHRAREGGRRRGHRRGRRLPAPRHLRLPVRPHARARRRAGARRRRGRLREPDGGPAHARPRERRPRRARRGPRARAGVRATPPASTPSSPATRPSSRRRRSARSRSENGRVLAKLVESPFYATGGGQIARRAARCAASRATAPRASRTSCGSATTRCWCSSPSRASCKRRARRRAGRPRRRAAPPSATTPPRTSCTRRCASASARTCARPAPTSGPTSCASTSPTARR